MLQVSIKVTRVGLCTREYKSTICICNMQLAIQRSVEEAPRVQHHNTAETDSANYTWTVHVQTVQTVHELHRTRCVPVKRKGKMIAFKLKCTCPNNDIATVWNIKLQPSYKLYHYLTSYFRLNWICRCLVCFSLNYKALPVSSNMTWMTSLVPNLLDQMGLNLWMSQPLYQHRCHNCTETVKRKEHT